MAVRLFYYTSSENYACIYQLGVIWTSAGYAGYGVYLTELPPSAGRMTVAEHLYENHQGKYVMTEVCLETDSITIPAEKLTGHPADKTWMSKTQLGLASFSVRYVASSGSLWKRTEVKDFITQEHRTFNPYSISPLSQLQEMVVQSGSRLHFVESFDGSMYVCRISVGRENAEGKGISEQMAKDEAAKSILRRLILAGSDNFSTETSHLHLTVGCETAENVTRLENVRTSNDSRDDMDIDEPGICSSVGPQESFRNNKAYKPEAMSEIPVEHKSDSYSRASEFYYNPVGNLQEYCIRNCLPLPNYEDIPLAVGDTMENFAVSVKIGDIVTEGRGCLKKLAKKAAATNMLEKLARMSLDEVRQYGRLRHSARLLVRDNIVIQTVNAGGQPPSNTVGKLQEFCVAKGLPLPAYKEVFEAGAAHAKTFTVRCHLLGYSVTGTGSSKKAAKQKAAFNMWKLVKDI